MAIVLLNQVINVTYGCKQQSQVGLNRVQYVITATGGAALTDQTVANALSTTVAASFKNYLPATGSYLGLRFQIVAPIPGSPGVSSVTGAGAGTVVSDPLPTQAAMLFSKQTPVPGKIGRGRLYLPFWTEDDNDNTGKPTNAALVAGNAVATILLNPIVIVSGGSTVTMTPCLAKKSNAWLPLILSGYVQRTQWATQRRRSQINRGDSTFPPV